MKMLIYKLKFKLCLLKILVNLWLKYGGIKYEMLLKLCDFIIVK